MTCVRSIVVPLLLLLACITTAVPAAAAPAATGTTVQETRVASSILITNPTTALINHPAQAPTRLAYGIRPSTAGGTESDFPGMNPEMHSSGPDRDMYAGSSQMTITSSTSAPGGHVIPVSEWIDKDGRPAARSDNVQINRPDNLEMLLPTGSNRGTVRGATTGHHARRLGMNTDDGQRPPTDPTQLQLRPEGSGQVGRCRSGAARACSWATTQRLAHVVPSEHGNLASDGTMTAREIPGSAWHARVEPTAPAPNPAVQPWRSPVAAG